MSTTGTTSIASLPSSETRQDPVQLVATEVGNKTAESPPVYNAQIPPGPTTSLLNQDEIVKALHKPGVSAMTRFPDKDLVMSESPHHLDARQRQEHIPEARCRDYIPEQDTVAQPQRQVEEDGFCDSCKVPLLVAASYFLFQTQTVRHLLNNMLPEGRSATGGLTLQNQVLSSLIFGLAIYGALELVAYVDY